MSTPEKPGVGTEPPIRTKFEACRAYIHFNLMIEAHSRLGFEHDGWLFCPCKEAQAIRVAQDALPSPRIFL